MAPTLSPILRVFPDASSAARAAAHLITTRSGEAVAARGRFALALSGGSTPRTAYEVLAGESVAWNAVHVFWSDERLVPAAHPDSNFRMTRHALLDRIPIPPDNIHRVPTELGALPSAARYSQDLTDLLGELPQLDLVLLGLGEDGHTASLFPWDPLLDERTKPVGVSLPRPGGGRRISLSLPTINAARERAFLVTGSAKAGVVRRVLQGPRDPVRLPAQGVGAGMTVWLLDESAAAELGI